MIIYNMMDICSYCQSTELQSSNDGRICQSCGWIHIAPEFQHDDVKYIEQKGKTKALLLKVDNPLQNISLYTQQKRIQEVIEECDQNIRIPDKKEILKVTQDALLRYKDTKVRLKSLISAVYFMVCMNSKKLISLDTFLKNLDVKSKQFNKYLIDLKQRYNIHQIEFEDQFEQGLLAFTKALSQYLNVRDQTFYKNVVLGFNEKSFLERAQELMRQKGLDMLNHPEIAFFRNGKNPFLYITSILVIVCQSALQITIELKTFAKYIGLNSQSLKNSIDNIENHILMQLSQMQNYRVSEVYKKFNKTQMQRYKQKLLKMFLKGGFIEDDNKSESTCFTEI